MKEKLQIEGYWWLPEGENHKVFGTFSYLPGEKFELKLHGILNDNEENKRLQYGDFIQPQIILGIESNSGKSITLYKCIQMGHTLSGAGLHITIFRPGIVFVGVHFENELEIKFKSISIGFANLEYWTNQRPITSERLDKDFRKLVIRYEHPNPISCTVNDTEIQVAFYGPSESWHQGTELTISYESRIDINPQQEKNFEEFLEILRRLQHFLSLAMGDATYPIAIIGLSDTNKIVRDDGSEFLLPVSIYYPVAWWPKDFKENYSFQMLFTLPNIEQKFDTYIRTWMEKFDLLEPAINLYFSVLYNPHSHAEVKFLSLAQALETYHRRSFGGKYQSDDEYMSELYKQLINAIPEELNGDFKKSLQTKLRYANEFSLRKRLRKILQSVEKELDFDFVQSRQAKENFIAKIADTRNYWTHYSPELADKAAQTAEERFILTTRLQLLLEVQFLKEIGFDSSAIKDVIQRSYRFKLLKSRNKS